MSQVGLLLQGERNFNRFGGWLGKNSTLGKNLRLLEDLHVHLLASRESSSGSSLCSTFELLVTNLMHLSLSFAMAYANI